LSFPRTRESREINITAGLTALETFYETIFFSERKKAPAKGLSLFYIIKNQVAYIAAFQII